MTELHEGFRAQYIVSAPEEAAIITTIIIIIIGLSSLN